MALLKMMKRIHILYVAGAALVSAVLLSGCDRDEQYGLSFNHFQHVTDLEIACADCHGEIGEKGFREIDHDACVDCHDDVVEADDINAETCGYCHKLKNLDDLGSEEDTPSTASRGVFVHTAALGGMCRDCHGMLFDERKDRVPEMSRSMLVNMRDRAHGFDMPCSACHVGFAADVEPASHARNWTRRHGFNGEQEPALCSTCHREETCRECHQTTMPQSHNNQWRLRTHGIKAAWDRQRCQVCHEQDSCAECHAEVKPRYHNAGWSKSHCFGCHTSMEAGTGCATCHEALIETHPSPHAAGWSRRHCDNCHDGSPEAETCVLCHPGGLDAHPDPHSAGWGTRHCDNCHEGTAEEQECRVCHPGSLETHVDPHTAGWEERHCFNCHTGAEAAEECGICHEGGGSLDSHSDYWPPVHDRFGVEIDCFFCHTP